MSDGPDQVRKVLLEAAVKAVMEHILQTAESSGIDTETVGLELQFGLEVAAGGKVVPVVFIDGQPPGTLVHKISFSLTSAPKEMARPDTSSELAMIMDHPPPRDSRPAQSAPSEPAKPADDDGIIDNPRPRDARTTQVTITEAPKPIVESKAPVHAARERQEIQVTLSDTVKPVVESKVSSVQAPQRPKPTEPPKAAQPTSPPPQASGQHAHGVGVGVGVKDTKPNAPAESRAEVEARFAMLDRIVAARDDEDEVDEPTVSDGFPVRREDEHKSSKGPKIVLPSNPVLKLRKASDVGQGRAGSGKVEEETTPSSPRPEPPAYQPPKPVEEVAPAEPQDEAMASGVESRFIIFDHQKLRRRYEISAESGPSESSDGPADQNPSGNAGAED